MNQLQNRIIEISKKLGLAHIGSNLSCLPILEEIYAKKKADDIVILDNAHAHLAHLVVRDIYEHKTLADRGRLESIVSAILVKGIHCDRGIGCDASGGSLGHGIGIGIGYALADRKRDVYVIVSDGSMMEGSNWEALRIISDLNIRNIRIHCNFNGYTAVSKYRFDVSKGRIVDYLDDEGVNITFHLTNNTEEFDGVQGHYKVLK